MPIDFKKTERELYAPGTKPGIVDVPEMIYIAADGRGDPNTTKEYPAAVEALYSLSYAIKMSYKSGNAPQGYYEHVVPPLEGFWTVDGDAFCGDGAIADKSKFAWTSCIRQPAFVTQRVLEWARDAVAKKKPALDLSGVYLWTFTEGLCAQIMHIGSYDAEPATIQTLTAFIQESGCKTDICGIRRHHEIYLGDPRKTAPEKLKTVIRYPIVRSEGK
ncbi:MAG: GyrI-like domain-containing protein [Oscillospiraceae bacterium]|jgi:hypothetical protein|nr:GyrI-like domain-containing protein [Oscillospiraceae bacterium]